MKFLEVLEEVLKSDSRFIGENNQVIRTKVADAARDMDALLIKSLLKDQLLRDSFFTKVDDVYVFDKMKFIWVLESKEFLPDSYTLYKNKIGLVDNQNNLISQKQDVSLVWPYKDCVLEGGQTKEDQKREEIFYNETLDPDEVNRLLAPKVLGNSKRYTVDGVEENIDFNNEDNLIIKGNNLLALSSILNKYSEKVKCIYIDPPYNTKNDSFKYNDKFNHSTWMTFIKNRLEIAKKMLSNNGVIFIQCDDNEQAYLSVLTSEIFGRENHIATLPTIMNLKGNQDQFGFAGTHEYILVFAKNINELKLNDLYIDNPDEMNEWEEDSIGVFKKGANLKATGTNAPRSKRPNLFYPVYISEDGKINFSKTSSNDYTLLPITDGKEMSWRWKKSTMKKNLQDIIVVENNNEYSLYKKQRPELGDLPTKRPKTIFYKPEYSSGNGTNQIKKLFGERAFSFAKPEELIYDIFTIATNKGDLILDFFMGSATSQAVALKMERRFIGIEQMDYIGEISVKRLNKVIKGEQGGISKDIGWQGGGSFVYCELLEDNQSLINEIQDATNSDTVKEVLVKATANGKIVPSVLPDDLKQTEEKFDRLSLDEQKELVLKLLDKNKLYINLSDLEDENANVSEADKAFTKSFYGLY